MSTILSLPLQVELSGFSVIHNKKEDADVLQELDCKVEQGNVLRRKNQ
jgi:hypothetical protein